MSSCTRVYSVLSYTIAFQFWLLITNDIWLHFRMSNELTLPCCNNPVQSAFLYTCIIIQVPWDQKLCYSVYGKKYIIFDHIHRLGMGYEVLSMFDWKKPKNYIAYHSFVRMTLMRTRYLRDMRISWELFHTLVSVIQGFHCICAQWCLVVWLLSVDFEYWRFPRSGRLRGRHPH